MQTRCLDVVKFFLKYHLARFNVVDKEWQLFPFPRSCVKMCFLCDGKTGMLFLSNGLRRRQGRDTIATTRRRRIRSIFLIY
jgi:hypothetical protein